MTTYQMENEVNLMKNIKHEPFVLRLLDSFSNARYFFLVLELAELVTLAEVLKISGPMDAIQTAHCVIQIASSPTITDVSY